MQTRRHKLLVLTLLVLHAASASGQGQGPSAEREHDDDHEVNLIIGQQKTIPANGVQSFSEGVPGIVQVKIPEDQRRLVVSAVRPGATTLLLFYANGRSETYYLNVYSKDPRTIRHELKGLFGANSGVEVRDVSGRIFLDGTVATQEDLARVERYAALYGGQVSSLITVDPTRQRTNIKVDLHFVQFSRSSSYKFGVNWPGNIGAGASSFLFTYDFVMRAVTQGQLVIADSLLPSLDILGVRGWAKVKNVVSVVTTNGGTATYHTGGEVNVRIATSLGQSTLQKIPFGTQIDVHPRYDEASGEMVVTIDTETSQLTTIQGQDVPGRSLTNNKTSVHLKVGQSIMLSGFSGNSETKSASGIPGLMRIPILGYLFRSEGGATEETQNILFITPTVIQHSSPQNQERINDAIKRYPDFGGQVVY